jgi:hypothetical protein
MFLAQNVKKFLKQSLQESKTATNEHEDLFQAMRDIERGCGLDPDDTSNDPAFHQLSGNSWHLAFGDD